MLGPVHVAIFYRLEGVTVALNGIMEIVILALKTSLKKKKLVVEKVQLLCTTRSF